MGRRVFDARQRVTAPDDDRRRRSDRRTCSRSGYQDLKPDDMHESDHSEPLQVPLQREANGKCRTRNVHHLGLANIEESP
jgi:hypothetical protein